MMFEFFGEEDERCIQAGQDIMQAIENVLINGPKQPISAVRQNL